MALKRLDEEFELKPGTQLLPYMQRLLPSLEGRFQAIEAEQDAVGKLTEEIRAAALMRMNEILIPATKDIIAVTKLGFLLAPVSTPYKLVMGYMAIYVDDGPQRKSFTPSPYLIIEHSLSDYGIARLIGYHQDDGLLEIDVTAIHGNAGPWDDWMVSSTPGMADSTKIYHDEVGPWRDEVAADYAAIVVLHQEIIAAADALASSGLDAYAFIRRDGTVPFIALQTGVNPPAGANDTNLATTAWARARMIEYANPKVNRSGDVMSGPLSVPTPTLPGHAASKAYVDNASFGGTLNTVLTINAVNPTIRLQTTGTGQGRIIEGRSMSGVPRWQLQIGDAGAEGGSNSGSQFAVLRYSDFGTYIDTPFWINRQDGTMTTKAINAGGAISCLTSFSLTGDMFVARAGSNTGVVYLGQSRNAYLYFDGSNYVFPSFGMSIAALSCGGITCTTINTQGNGITVGGITNTGGMSAAGTANVGALQINSTANMIVMNDTDWGVMYIHHNGDLMGYLNNTGNWIHYTTNAGHIWSAQYGWLHDYINNAASNYAWGAANSKDGAINNAQSTANTANTAAYNAQVTANNGWNQAVYATNLGNGAQGSANNAQGTANDAWNRANNAQGTANNAQSQGDYATGLAQYAVNLANQRVEGLRLVYAGGPGLNYDGNYHEDVQNGLITGYAAGRGTIGNFMYRYLQALVGGNWVLVGYA